MDEQNELTPFDGKHIRKVWYDEQWYFSIVDVVEILSDSPLPRQYWNKVKKSIVNESQTYPFWIQLKMTAQDGRNRLTDCANTQGILRIVMSVPSPKAEPLRQWMAQVSTERIEETENPELGFERLREIYKAKGRTDEWITSRLKSIGIRKELTNEWQKRGVKEGQEYSNLTATISRGTFSMNPSEHKKLKGLDKPSQELRDHMTNLELLFTALGEELTRVEAVGKNAQGYEENHEAAQKGGYNAGEARKRVEELQGLKVVSSENFLPPSKDGNSVDLPPADTE